MNFYPNQKDLVDDLLVQAKLQAGKPEPEPEKEYEFPTPADGEDYKNNFESRVL